MVVIPLQVKVSMGGLAVHSNRKGIVCLRCNWGIKEGNGLISLANFNSKFDCWIYAIDMFQEC